MKFNYSDFRIIRQHAPLLTGLTVLCLVLFFLIYINLSAYHNNLTKLNSLAGEIQKYNEKKSLLDVKTQVLDSEFNLDEANETLGQLIPVKEDYFSILAALEQLSAKTNFIISSYNINVEESLPNKLAIIIEGEGDPNTFLEFLRDYNFAGGRLITIDNIDFSQEAFAGTKVDINVYTGKVEASSTDSKDIDLELMKTILAKVQVNLKTEQTAVVDYPTKSNPF